MSLIQRTRRPLSRDKQSFRDDRLFIIACDDTYAPKQYFDFFQLPRVQVQVIATQDGQSHAQFVLQRLKEIAFDEDDQRWMLLDTDHCTKKEHLPSYLQALKEANEAGVQVALSCPSFEFWLLLHHLDLAEIGELKNAKQVEDLLRNTLGTYNKTRLKAEHFPPSSLALACRRAAALDNPSETIPSINGSRVYLLWREIVQAALPSQLSTEMQILRDMFVNFLA
ncbi:MAG: RloB domain-containing protein [Burkholderiales bacterium]|nr:RloB domain-containing protein [Burkholderiales bacterium]